MKNTILVVLVLCLLPFAATAQPQAPKNPQAKVVPTTTEWGVKEAKDVMTDRDVLELRAVRTIVADGQPRTYELRIPCVNGAVDTVLLATYDGMPPKTTSRVITYPTFIPNAEQWTRLITTRIDADDAKAQFLNVSLDYINETRVSAGIVTPFPQQRLLIKGVFVDEVVEFDFTPLMVMRAHIMKACFSK